MQKIMRVIVLLLILSFGGMFCYSKYFKQETHLYNGRLEADTVKLSAQTTGIVNMLSVDEGDEVEPKQVIAVVNKEKLLVQLQQVQTDLNFNRDLLKKTEAMLLSGAATKQRRDELAAKVDILKAQKNGIELQLSDAAVRSPIKGVVLNKYVNKGELVGPGSLIVDVADLTELKALIYLPLTELSAIKIGQPVKVYVDGLKEGRPGKIVWVSSEAEFTPKTILTKETRTTLVYAVKIKVPNKDGKLKIGMPIDVDILPKK
jgi:HlyD family secretion protein